MAIQLSENDYNRLAEILGGHGEWQGVRGRIDFMADVFAASSRRADILTQLDLDGAPRPTAVRVIHRLMTFGQDKPGRESLGVLINKLIAYLGDGEDANFLRSLLARYPFAIPPVAARGISDWRGSETEIGVSEKIIGENTLRDIYVLEVLLGLSRCVARVSGPEGLGTGFLVSSDLLLTAHHVISDKHVARNCVVHFNYQLDRSGKALPVESVKTLLGGKFCTSPVAPHNATSAELDYTVVQLEDPQKDIEPMSLRSGRVARDERVTIIQHPGGDYKKISLQNNFVEYVDEHIVQYTTSTEPGSSGSPVLDKDFQVVAVHHAGGDLSEPVTKRRYRRNEGVRVSAILKDLRQRAPEIYESIGK